ncbi:hypothetical protein C8R47DRAFT_1228857 [Mycena vitilis]|nr:hypothetical protein C8R47DRAFT_1228857 [Mycena vitilis]
MTATVRQLIFILELFFPPELAMQQALHVLAVLISLYPILCLHSNQMNEARRQSPQTGWKKSIHTLLTRAFREEANNVEAWTTGINLAPEYSNYICRDLDRIYTLLGLSQTNMDPAAFQFRPPRRILTTSRVDCRFCPPGDRNLLPSLRRRAGKKPNQHILLLDATYKWVSADLVVARCSKCKADYYPDVITRKVQGSRQRIQLLEYDAEYLCVSKQGTWAHRKIALAQEKAVQRLHCGWSNFADWVNDITEDTNHQLSYGQAQKLFVQHFSRRLLIAHGEASTFTSYAHAPTKFLAAAVRSVIGENGGVIPGAMDHGCMDCTHVKRYGAPALTVGGGADVVGSEAGPAGPIDPALVEDPLPPNLPESVPMQDSPPPGDPLGYERLSVMDGKTVTHKKCALNDCKNPLYNYKNGRFCEDHLPLRLVCGIIPCGLPIRSADSVTCATPAHIQWHKQYEDRFHRLNFPGVQRVIRRQAGTATAAGAAHPVRGPSLQVQLQALGETPGDQVVHTFKAKTIYCLQTIQWACGVPIGWGKCYKSESAPQVLAFLNKVWEDYPDKRPGFVVYDKACELLRHIIFYVVQDAIQLRRMVLSRIWAFNTETAEQLNSWISGYESQLRQMTDVNYDFYIHVLMMMYGEMVEKRVVSKHRELTDEFWDEVNGIATDLELQ